MCIYTHTVHVCLVSVEGAGIFFGIEIKLQKVKRSFYSDN